MPSKRAFDSAPHSDQNSKRRRTENTIPQPQQPDAGASGWWGILGNVANMMARPFKRDVAPAAGTERHPRRSLAAQMQQTSAMQRATGPPSSASVIVVDDTSEIDPEEDRMRKEQQVAGRREALRHLNDHARPFTDRAESSSSVPDLGESPRSVLDFTKPLFESAFHNYVPDVEDVGGPSKPRPDVSYARPERQRTWIRDESPSSVRTSSSSSSARRRRVSRGTNLRTPNGKAQQLELLEKLVANAERTDSPNVAAFRRARDELLRAQGLTTPKKSAYVVKKAAYESKKSDLESIFKGLHVDNRKKLDEAIAPVDKKFVPRPVSVKIRPPPKPLDLTKSYILEELDKQDQEREKLLKKRLAKAKKVKIPSALTPEQQSIYDARLKDSYFKVTTGSAEVDARSLSRLRGTTWLNDDIVGFYMELINSRAKETGAKVFAMNTFFYQKLSEQGYAGANLKRWTKRMKLDIFSLDKLLIPINIGNSHWVCAVINFADKCIEYYDSMADCGRRLETFKHLRAYLQAEHKEKKGSTFDLSGWRDCFNPNTPKQDNMSDCGVFACQTLETSARGKNLQVDGSFKFDCSNMPYFRKLMVIEIASAKLSERPWDP